MTEYKPVFVGAVAAIKNRFRQFMNKSDHAEFL